ncbi:MAG: lysophospholipid acyltransferase family protein [Bacteroidota bacterium]
MLVSLAKLIFLIPITLVFSVWALMTIPFDRSGRYFRKSPWWWSRFIFWTFGMKVSVIGYENLDPMKPYIFISNHASMFDIPTVFVALKGNVNIVFKKELTYVPIWGWALRYGYFIMIERSNPRKAMASIERAAQSIRKGSSVILFPEGTRTLDGKLQPFKRGAFSLAAKAEVPVVPLTINGTFTIMPKGSLNIKPANISVVLGKPISTLGLNGKGGELELMEQVHHVIEKNYINQA